ncbi:hypothetical protein ES703_47485 [subsurface metagenome]
MLDDIENGISTHELKSWNEFFEFIRTKHSNCPAFIYRGQACSEWKVDSTLDRLERRFPTRPNFSGGIPAHFEHPPTSREIHINAFKEAVRGKRTSNPPELADDEWWALAQHHGLATPMLDWTYSPFVALFFAFEEKYINSSGQWTEPEKRVVYTLSVTCISEKNTEDSPAPLVFSPKGETSYRLINQAGIFVKMPEKTDLESYVRENFVRETTKTAIPPQSARAILEKIMIPNNDRINCLKLLNKMNINRMSLFPDIDGSARYINNLWELDFDTVRGLNLQDFCR